MNNQALKIGGLIGSILMVIGIITLVVMNDHKSSTIGFLTEDLKAATNKVQFLAGQVVSAGTNYTFQHGRALALEGERDTFAAQVRKLEGEKTTLAGQVATLQGEKALLEADKASLASNATKLLAEKNLLALQVTTLEGEKSGLTNQVNDLTTERDVLGNLVKSLRTQNLDLTKQIATLTTTRTRTTSGGVQVNVIQTGTGIGSAKSSFTTNGVVGGVPALFVNKVEQTVIMTVRGNGVTFTLDLKAKNGVKRFDILPGEYNYNYTVGDDPTLLPEGGSATFTVDKESSHFLEGYGAFNGGAIFRGKQ